MSFPVNPHLGGLKPSPFDRLRDLLEGIAPGRPPLILSIGEPQEPPPELLARQVAQASGDWHRYPPVAGTQAYRQSCAGWLDRRFGLPDIDPDRNIIACAGTKEALYTAAEITVAGPRGEERPVILLPNPYYGTYWGAAAMRGAEPVTVAADAGGGFLPDYEALPETVLKRTRLAYLCTPSNPQGAVAGPDRLRSLIALARRHGFVLAVDECYAEIYDRQAPSSVLAAAAGDFTGLLAFHSLSKRSNAAGLRLGFVAGDAALIALFRRLRAYGGATVPLPLQAAGAALWADDAHAAGIREAYRRKIGLSQRFLGHLPGYRRPEAGFFAWLDVGDGVAVTRELWARAGVRVLPGAFLAEPDASGGNPGARYIRIALVHPEPVLAEALQRLARVLDELVDRI